MRAPPALVLLLSICISAATSVEGTTPLKKKWSRPRLLARQGPLCSRKCGGGAGRHAAGQPFPPYRCSCSRSCAVFGDCCYDSSHRSVVEMRQQFQFVCVSVIGRSGYQVVSNCPPRLFTDNSENCEGNLGLLPPVTSSQTNITYANFYCALCNGDADHLIKWNVDLSCPSVTEDAIFGHYNRIEYSSHDFWVRNAILRTKRLCKFKVRNEDFQTIDRLELRPCVTVNKISRCSSSWKEPTSAKKCLSYEDPVFLDNRAFRNPHCAHCNYVNLSYVECVPLNLRKTTPQRKNVRDDVIRYCTTHHCHLDLGNGRAYAVSQAFNVFYSEKSCSKGERYDPYTCRCRTVVKRRKNFVN